MLSEPQNYASTEINCSTRPVDELCVHSQSTGADVIKEKAFSIERGEGSAIDFYVFKFELPNSFGQKRGLLGVGLDQDYVQGGHHQFQRYAGETSTGANVGEPTISIYENRRGEHALPEVKTYDIDRVCDRC